MPSSLVSRAAADSASFGPVGMTAARSLLYTDEVLFGTDMPIFDAERALDTWWLSRHAGTRTARTIPAPGPELPA